MRCKTLMVFYEQDDAKADQSKSLKAATPGPGGQQRIKRLEARGGVVVTQKDQTATGETGVFDMKSNTVTLNGEVVMTQGQNVLRGDRLVVNLTNGVRASSPARMAGTAYKACSCPPTGRSSSSRVRRAGRRRSRRGLIDRKRSLSRAGYSRQRGIS